MRKALFFFLLMMGSAFAQYSYSSILSCSGNCSVIVAEFPGGGGGPPLPPEAIQVEKRPTNQLLAFLAGNAEGNLRLDSPIILMVAAAMVIIAVTYRRKKSEKEGE